jgi:hypothetical protein
LFGLTSQGHAVAALPTDQPEKVMMAAASISNATIARAAQLVGFAVVAASLAVVSWRDTSLNLPDVGQFAGIIGSGFLGGIINPLMKALTGSVTSSVTVTAQQSDASEQGTVAQATRTIEAAQQEAAAELGKKSDLMWEIAVVIGAVTVVVAALALAIDGSRHVNAAPALTALVTAFAALFLDTSKITHTAVAS